MRILVYTPVLTEMPSLGDYLVRADIAVTEAEDGGDLIESALLEEPQIILLDEDMPGGGFELVRRLRVEAGAATAAVLMRTRRATQAPIEGVICLPRGDGAQAVLAALTRLLLVPVRASVRTYALLQLLRRPDGESIAEGQIVDISISGLKLKTTQSLRPGDTLNLSFVLAPGEPLVIAGARVVRSAGEERGQRAYGLEFTDLRPYDREHLQACIDRLVERIAAPQPSAV